MNRFVKIKYKLHYKSGEIRTAYGMVINEYAEYDYGAGHVLSEIILKQIARDLKLYKNNKKLFKVVVFLDNILTKEVPLDKRYIDNPVSKLYTSCGEGR